MKSLTKANLEKIVTEDLKNLRSKEVIYKYTSLSTGIDDILLKDTLRFSDPTEFNDPFDCHEYLLNVDMSNANTEEYIESQCFNYPRSIKGVLAQIVDVIINTDEIYKGIKAERKQTKITCFSCDQKSTLLWSHYADKHKGICIGFRFPTEYDDKFILSPVRYIDKIPLFNGKVEAFNMIRYWLSMKSECWEYEKEIRAILKLKSNSSFEYIQYERNCIKEIIFGCQVTQVQINDSKSKLIDNGFILNDILMKKMIIDKDTFKLNEIII